MTYLSRVKYRTRRVVRVPGTAYTACQPSNLEVALMQSAHSFRSRLQRRFGAVSTIGLLALGLALAAQLSPLKAALHIGLASSVPAKGAHLMTAPKEIRLTFTDAVNVSKAGVELVAPGGATVATDTLRAVPDSARVAVAKINDKLTSSGTYTVKWKAVSADGAAGSGSFPFMYMPQP